MSYAYFLTMANPTSDVEPLAYLPIDPLIYAQKLQERWTDAKITFYQQDKNEGYILGFAIPLQNNPNWNLTGGLQRTLDCVTFDSAPKEDLCSFVLWHRSFVPISQQVFLWHEVGWEDVLELNENTTEQNQYPRQLCGILKISVRTNATERR